MILRTSDSGHHYLTKIAGEYAVVKVMDVLGTELMQLVAGKKVWKKDNLQLRDSLPLLIYSPGSDRYWYRILKKDHDLAPYRRYIKDGNLYIYFNDEWKKRVKEEVEREGMGYYDMNKLRSLLLLKEILEGQKNRSDIKIKTRAIEIEINNVKQKYK
jgi:hypothetical protein